MRQNNVDFAALQSQIDNQLAEISAINEHLAEQEQAEEQAACLRSSKQRNIISKIINTMKQKLFQKSLLLFACALFPLMGASEMTAADTYITSGKTFRFNNKRAGYLRYNSESGKIVGTSTASEASVFTLVTNSTLNGGIYYLYDVTNNSFVHHTGDNPTNPGSSGNYSSESEPETHMLVRGRFWFESTGDTSYPYKITDSSGNTFNIDGQGWACFNGWYATDDGNCFAIEYLEDITTDSEVYQQALTLLDNYFTYAELSSDNTTLTFKYDNERANSSGTTYSLNTGANDPEWYSNENKTSITSVVFTYNFYSYAKPTSTFRWFSGMTSLSGIQNLSYLNTSEVTDMRGMFYNCSSLTSLSLSSFNTAKVTRMDYMFQKCSALTSLNVSSFNTALVTNMSAMFDGCSSLTSLDVSNFNTANVTNMSQMFHDCSKLTTLDVSGFSTAKVSNFYMMFYNCSKLTALDVSGFNTAKATSMAYMFSYCSALTNLDVSGFNTTTVTAMNYMFDHCNKLTSLDVSGFNTAKVTNMNYMFCYCSKLTDLDVSNFNTALVTDMGYMFRGCYLLKTLDISSFNTAKVSKMDYMFANCDSLNTIYVSSAWTTAAVTSSSYMFTMSRKLVGGAGTTYNESNPKDATYARIDGGTGNEGYLTSNIISFADANVKSICVTKWDTDGDGELSIAEAKAVTEIYNEFSQNKNITSFNELQYFTNLTTLRMDAFHDCTALQSITLPESLTTISTNCFWNCSSLQSLYIPKNVTSISEEYVTAGCTALESIIVDTENTKYASPNNCNAIIQEDTLLVAGCKNTVIPDGVTTIGRSSMLGLPITSIVIPASVTEIRRIAFSNCTQLTTVTMQGTTPPRMMKNAFPASTFKENCILLVPDDSREAYILAEASESGAKTYVETFKEIRMASFPGHVHIDNVEATTSSDLTTLAVLDNDVEESMPTFTVTAGAPAYFQFNSSIGGWQKKVDGEWTNVRSGVFTPGTWRFQSVVRIDGDNAASYVLARPLTVKVNDVEWTLGTLLTSETYSFTFANSPEYEVMLPIDEAHFPDANFRLMLSDETYLNIDSDHDLYLSAEEIAAVTELDLSSYGAYFSDLTGIGYFTALQSLNVEGCSSLTSLDLSKNTALQSLTTRFCKALTALDLSHNTEITYFDCQQCGNIAVLDLSANTKLQEVICHTNNTSSLIMPSNSTTLHYITCYNNQLKGTAMDAFVNSLPERPEDYPGIIYIIDQSEGNTEGNIATTSQVQIATGKRWNVQNGNAYEYPGIEVIDFADANVKSICVTNWDTDGDGELSYDEAAAVTSEQLGQTFQSNNDITSFDELQYFTGLTEIPIHAFTNCQNLASIKLPNTITAIRDYSFQQCFALTEIDIPESVKSIGTLVFTRCTSLSVLQLHEGLETIGAYSLSDIAIDSFSIPSTVTNIDDAFYNGYYELTGVHPKYVSVIWWEPIAITENTFPNRANATLFVPAGKEDVYRAAPYWQEFGTITSKIDFNDPAVKAICIANWDTDGDGELTYDEAAAVTTLGEAFKGNTEILVFNELQYFTGLDDGTEYHNHILTYEAFQGCTELRTVTLPSNITKIDNRAFQGCSSLNYVGTIPNAVTLIGDQAFEGCSSLTSIVLPTSLRMISYHMFKDCSSLRWISIPEGITYYGDLAFDGCTSLTQVTVHETTPPVINTDYNDPFPTRADINLIVPAHTSDAYSTADYWKEFKNFKELEPDWLTYTDENGDIYQYEIGYPAQLYHYADNSSRTSFLMPTTITVDGITYSVTAIAGLQTAYLQSLTIPSSVTTLKDNALYIHPVPDAGFSVKEIYMRRNEPPTVGDVSEWITAIVAYNMNMEAQYPGDASKKVSLKDITLYVPTGSLSLYQEATFWKEFTIVEYDLPAIETYVLLSTDGKTLTFYNDREKANRQGSFYSLNTGTEKPAWTSDDNIAQAIETVVFDPSFARVEPTSTAYWFYQMSNLTAIQNLHNLHTSQTTTMRYMFSGCGLTEIDLCTPLIEFCTDEVTDMLAMFANCTNLTAIDLSTFNTEKVTDMRWMFNYCTELPVLDITSFSTPALQATYQMFSGCFKLTTIYASDSWTTSAVNRTNDNYYTNMFTGDTLLKGGQGTTYQSSEGIDIDYARIDGGTDAPGYFSYKPYAVLASNGQTLTFYLDGKRSEKTGFIYDIEATGTPGWYNYASYVRTVTFDPSFADARPTSTFSWFARMVNLSAINGLAYLNTSEVTDMRYMFYNCQALEHLDLSTFNTEEVVNMTNMFLYCSSMQTLDLSSFNTSKVKSMFQMFGGCDVLTTIYAGNGWTTDALEGDGNMKLFLMDEQLVGGAGTTYDDNAYSAEGGGGVDAQYARIDGGTDAPGYFTAKPAFLRGDVNGDGQVTIADVTALVNIILGKSAAPANGVADVNSDSSVTIADVTALVNIILGK